MGAKIPSIAVLILNHNGMRFLPACYDSVLANQRVVFDLYLIDNGSQDDSVSMTETEYPMIRVIRNAENLGYGAAYDGAIRTIRHPYVVLLNNDTVVDSDWLAELFSAARADPRVAACGSRILMLERRDTVDHGGGLFSLIGSGVDVGKWCRKPPERGEPHPTGFGCGCSLLIRRDAYFDVGGFDTSYGYYHEDVDLCWRFRLSGYSVVHVPGSVVFHMLGGGRKVRHDDDPWKIFHCQKNRLVNILKNLGISRLVAALILSSVYDGMRLLIFMVSGRRDLMRSVAAGYRFVLGDLKRILEKRRRVQSRRCCPDRSLSPYFLSVAESFREYRRLRRASGTLL